MSKNQSGLLPDSRSVLLKLESVTQNDCVLLSLGLVGLTGLEPVTLRLSSACSNQLSYAPMFRVLGCDFRSLGFEQACRHSALFSISKN